MARKKMTKLWEWQQRTETSSEKCEKCGSLNQLTVDHIIPQFILQQLGLYDEVFNDEENFEIMCRICNRMKGARIDLRHPKTFPLLEKYLALSKKLVSK